MNIKPSIFYTIWFSQRNGSTLLCEGLKATGIAGKPGEWVEMPQNTSLLEFYQAASYEDLQTKLWNQGTANGVFGIKANAPRKENDLIMQELSQIPGVEPTTTHFEIWENAFPNGKHIFLTRINKIRQAVSWWKAIVTQQWHLVKGEEKQPFKNKLREQYNFEAIKHLLLEISLRESKIQAFLEEGNIVPLTIVYEDFIKEYVQTIRNVITFLGITQAEYPVKEPYYAQLSDEVSEEWIERFRKELQKDWKNVIW
jgi:trehalose 2-sulfotransferase